MKHAVSMTSSMLIMLTAGCLSPMKTVQVVDEGLQAHREIPKSIYGAARSVPGADQGVIDMYEGGFQQRMDAQAGRIVELKQQVAKEAQARKELLLTIARVAATAVGVSVPEGTFDEILGRAFGQVMDHAKDETEVVSQSLQKHVVESAGTLAALQKEVIELKAAAKTASKILDKDEKVRQEAEKQRREREKEREKWLTGQLSKLENFDPEKFKAELERQQELVAGKKGAELKAAILKEAKEAAIPKEMLEQLKGMTPNEIMALIGTGGSAGLLGLLALLRSFGPSRSQRQTDILNQLVANQKEEVDRLRGGPVASSTSTNPTTTSPAGTGAST